MSNHCFSIYHRINENRDTLEITDYLPDVQAGPGAPNVFLEAGIHAREWIAPAVATFLIRELVEDYSEHPDYLDKLNWYFIPSANPDGYTYRYCTVLYCTVLYCTVLYCTVLYCTVLYCTVLYCTVL